MNKYIKQYLPSKKFRYLLVSFLIIALVFFFAFKLFSGKNSFFASKNDAKIQVENLTLNQLVQKDSDGDGVTDWEEALWGTDPNKKATFDDIPDADYIKNRRAELKVTEPVNSGDLTETDKFAREFFATYSALKTTGQADSNTINNFSTALGQKITDSTLIDKYLEKDVKLTGGDETTDQEDYYVTAGNLFEKYKSAGIGDELEIAGGIANTGSTEDTQNEDKLIKIATAYQEFAQKLLLVPVPKSLVSYHLRIINSANNTGIAVINMSKMLTDPIIGISGTSQYEKYSNNLINSVNDLETFLSINGIITG